MKNMTNRGVGNSWQLSADRMLFELNRIKQYWIELNVVRIESNQTLLTWIKLNWIECRLNWIESNRILFVLNWIESIKFLISSFESWIESSRKVHESESNRFNFTYQILSRELNHHKKVMSLNRIDSIFICQILSRELNHHEKSWVWIESILFWETNFWVASWIE